MIVTDLDRRFIEWKKDSNLEPELAVLWSPKTLSWKDLLSQKRVVLLAEAGSGKSVELREQARLLNTKGCFAFYATVEDVGREGLASSLSIVDRSKLEEWRLSNQPGYFFIDSIDEAKLNHIRLSKALRKIADGIVNAEARAHIILSSRYTDWELILDLESVKEKLSTPKKSAEFLPLSPDKILIHTLVRNPKKDGPNSTEEPLIVFMVPLDSKRIRQFASDKNVSNLNDFMSALESSNLTGMANRPLNLEWLVKFWISKGEFGSYTEMLEHSIDELLRETDQQRRNGDALKLTQCRKAIERIGAALVFGQKRTLSLLDSDKMTNFQKGAQSLSDILPDWSSEDLNKLQSRRIFDPATYGRFRLHNDNESEIRSFLTARWLFGLRSAGCPIQTIHNLLFTETYGIKVIKPSLQETAAWLAQWDESVRKEILLRNPSLFLTAGDPKSLPVDLRQLALTKVIELITQDNSKISTFDPNTLARFSTPDIAEHIRSLWKSNRTNPTARHLLLELIWRGSLSDCSDIAEAAVFDETYKDDEFTLVLGGRSLISTADKYGKVIYAKHICTHCSLLPEIMIYDALEALFPEFISIENLFEVLNVIDLANHVGGIKALVSRLQSSSDLELFISNLLNFIKNKFKNPQGREDRLENETLVELSVPPLAVAAQRLLEMLPLDQISIPAVDAILKIAEIIRHTYTPSTKETYEKVCSLLHKTAARRGLSFWHAAEHFNTSSKLCGKSLKDTWEMERFGYIPNLHLEDLSWLLQDATTKQKTTDGLLAINASMKLWVKNGRQVEILEQINGAVQTNRELREIVSEWLRPHNQSQEEQESFRQIQCMKLAENERQAAIDLSWQELVKDLRSNPDQLRHLPPPTSKKIDNRLYSIWCLLNKENENKGRYAIEDLSLLEPILGLSVIEAAKEAFIKFWRAWRPHLRSAYPPNERNSTYVIDLIGLVGISIEAKDNPVWASSLSNEEAELAASYATLEINGFPIWFSALATAKPSAVKKVLAQEIISELNHASSNYHCNLLETIQYGSDVIIQIIAPILLDEFKQRVNLPLHALDSLLNIVSRVADKEDPSFLSLAIARFDEACQNDIGVSYLIPVFALQPNVALIELDKKLGLMMSFEEQAELVQTFLSKTFGEHFRQQNIDLTALPFDVIKDLVLKAYKFIQVGEDNRRPNLMAYSPGERDNAQWIRDALFGQLTNIPGRATFNMLIRLSQMPDFPIPPKWLKTFAFERAAKDSESKAWLAKEFFDFEKDFDTIPHICEDLQRVAIHRLEDIQHSLLNNDFTQGSTLATLSNETAVQNWIADRLRLMQGRAYSVEREPHVVREKKPDIRLRAKTSPDASVAIEIKIIDNLSLKDMKKALEEQLCDQYLREQSARHGILLLVYQKPKKRGWKKEGKWLTLEEVVQLLEELAVKISGSAQYAPQPVIAVIDVSSTSR